jgi:hypothetical protein
MAILISRAGTCTVTFRYDTASFTATDLLEKCLQAGFDEVVALGRPAPRPAARRRAAAGKGATASRNTTSRGATSARRTTTDKPRTASPRRKKETP